MADIKKLGRYDILRVLGKGAMGVVYAGVDPNLERQVAIKTIRMQTLSPEAATEFEGRFRTEARSAARLHHPNIVSVFDSGHDGDTTFLVMELIEGQDLKHHLESGARFSVRTALLMVHDLLLALEHAHQQKVVHRDVKPANILIESNGRVKLTDFGVARIQDPEESGLTQVGGSVGTPRYMAPEQAKGLRGDARSDLFSAAVVLYELLTGEPPFRGENAFVIIHQITSHEPPPPRTLNPDVPPELDTVLQKGLAKDPTARFASAREFALALRAIVKTMPLAGGDTRARTRLSGEDDSFQDGSSTSIFGPGDELASTTPTASAEADTETLVQPNPAEPPGISARRSRSLAVGVGAGLLALAIGLAWWALHTPKARTDVATDVVVAPAPAASVALAPVAPASAAPTTQWPVEEIIETTRRPPPGARGAASAAQVPASGRGAPQASTTTAAAATAPAAAASTAAQAAHAAPAQTASRAPTGAGPSATGEACADKGFLFRIPCVARQCNTDRYRHTKECVDFREMERQREEGREFRR